jgi:uncharacterized protein (TIGR02996 family)
MSTEAAFLEALKALPADDTARLVYADWLDEHGRAQEAVYLRLVVALTRTCEDATREHPEVARLLALAETLPVDWRAAAGSRFVLVFYACTEAAQKVLTIKLIREVTGKGLGEAKHACEQTPSKLLPNVPFEQALVVRDRFREVPGTRVLIHPWELTVLPYTVVYSIVASRHVWLEGQENQAEAAFLNLLQKALSIATDAARALAGNNQVTIAENLELPEVQRCLNKLRPHIPIWRAGNGWSISLTHYPTAIRPTRSQ